MKWLDSRSLEGMPDCNALVFHVLYRQGSRLVYRLSYQGAIPALNAGEPYPKQHWEIEVDKKGFCDRARETAAIYDRTLRDLAGMRTSTDEDAEKDRELYMVNALGALAGLGKELARSVLPAELRKHIARLSAAQVIVVISTEVDWIPWELLYIEELGDFLGGTFVVARQNGWVEQSGPSLAEKSATPCAVAAKDFHERHSSSFTEGLFGTTEILTGTKFTQEHLKQKIGNHQAVAILGHIARGEMCLGVLKSGKSGLLRWTYVDRDFFRNTLLDTGEGILVILGCRSLSSSAAPLGFSSFAHEYVGGHPRRSCVGTILDTHVDEAVAVSNVLASELDQGSSVARSLSIAKTQLRTRFPGVMFFGVTGLWELGKSC